MPTLTGDNKSRAVCAKGLAAIVIIIVCLGLFSNTLLAQEPQRNNPFAETSNVNLTDNGFDEEYLDSIEGIVDIEETPAQEVIPSLTEVAEEIDGLIEEIQEIVAEAQSSDSVPEAENPGQDGEPRAAEPATEESQESSQERRIVNEIKYGYKKTEEKLKAGQKPEAIIASMKYTKKYVDQLRTINPGNPWVANINQYLVRTVANQIKFGTAQLKKKTGAAADSTAAWLSAWLKANRDMNLGIGQDILQAAEKALEAYQAENRNRPALADNQRGGKVLKVPMRNQRLNSVGPAWSCGPTSLGMAMEYLGKKVSSVQLISDCGTNRNGTDHAGMVRGAKKNGFSGARWVYGESAAWVRRQIDAGKPVVVNVPNHYMVCIGYDSRGYLIFNDPNGGRELVWSPSHFEANWVHGHAALILQ